MQKAVISGISRIQKNKAGEDINIISIQLANGKKNIVRSLEQFKRDLDNSGRIVGVDLDYVTTVNHPAVVNACTKLLEGEVSGEFKYVKEGEEYTVTENMSIITNPAHPEYGSVAVGDKAHYSADMTLVTEGFLQLTPSMKQLMVEEQAFQLAQLMSATMGVFGGQSSASNSKADEAEEIPAEALVFAEGAGKPVTEDQTA